MLKIIQCNTLKVIISHLDVEDLSITTHNCFMTNRQNKVQGLKTRRMKIFLVCHPFEGVL